MELKGSWKNNVSYSVGDVVMFTDGVVYHLQHAAPVGAPPTDTRYWGQLEKLLGEAVKLILDAITLAEAGALDGKVANNLTTTASGKVLDARQGKALKGLIEDLVIPDNIDSKSILLGSSTAESTKQYLITISDPGEGEDPALTITEYTPDGGES